MLYCRPVRKFNLEQQNEGGSNKSKRPYMVLLLVASLCSFFVGMSIKNFIPVATVNGEAIATPLFAKELLRFGGKQVISDLIVEKLIFQEAKKKHIAVSKSEIKSSVSELEDNLKKQHLTLKDLLVAQNRSKADFEHEIELQHIIEKLFKNEVSVSDLDVEKYFTSAGIKKGEGALYESQKIAIVNNIRRDKLRNALSQWIALQKKTVKVNFLIKL